MYAILIEHVWCSVLNALALVGSQNLVILFHSATCLEIYNTMVSHGDRTLSNSVERVTEAFTIICGTDGTRNVWDLKRGFARCVA